MQKTNAKRPAYADLPDDVKQMLLRGRSKAASDGVEMSPEEFYKTLLDANDTISELMGIDNALLRVKADRLPPPPYEGHFETFEEAESFRLEAERQHKIPLESVLRGHRCWVVQEPERAIAKMLIDVMMDKAALPTYREAWQSGAIDIQGIAEVISDTMEADGVGNQTHADLLENLRAGRYNDLIERRLKC